MHIVFVSATPSNKWTEWAIEQVSLYLAMYTADKTSVSTEVKISRIAFTLNQINSVIIY